MPDEETAGKDSAEETDDSEASQEDSQTGDKETSGKETTEKQDSQPSDLQKQLDAYEAQIKAERKKAADFQAAKDKLEAQVKEKDREGMDELERAKADKEESEARLQDLEEQNLALQAKVETQKVLSDLSDPDTKKIVELLVTEPEEGAEDVTLESIAKEIDKVIQGIRKSSKTEDADKEASSVETESGNTALQPKKDAAKEELEKGNIQGAILEKLRRKRK